MASLGPIRGKSSTRLSFFAVHRAKMSSPQQQGLHWANNHSNNKNWHRTYISYHERTNKPETKSIGKKKKKWCRQCLLKDNSPNSFLFYLAVTNDLSRASPLPGLRSWSTTTATRSGCLPVPPTGCLKFISITTLSTIPSELSGESYKTTR